MPPERRGETECAFLLGRRAGDTKFVSDLIYGQQWIDTRNCVNFLRQRCFFALFSRGGKGELHLAFLTRRPTPRQHTYKLGKGHLYSAPQLRSIKRPTLLLPEPRNGKKDRIIESKDPSGFLPSEFL